MKGLFKSKPRTPADVVRQTRELLVYLDLNSGPRSGDAKREEKVRSESGLSVFSGFDSPSLTVIYVSIALDWGLLSCFCSILLNSVHLVTDGGDAGSWSSDTSRCYLLLLCNF